MTFGVSRFRRLLPVACASLAMTNICDLLDSIIAGRLLGEGALGAVELVWPLIELVYFVGASIANGTAILHVAAVGAFNKRRARELFSNGVIFSVVAGLAVVAGMVLLREPFFAFAGVGPETIAYVRPYWNWLLLYPALALLNQYLMTMVCMDGDTTSGTLAFIAEFIANVAVTWFACRVLGTAGCALGLVSGQVASMVVLTRHFLLKGNSLVFRMYFSLRDTWRALITEFPASSAILFTSLVYVFLNTVLVARAGDSALVVLAVLSVSNNLMLFLFGIPNAAQPVVGVCWQERDVAGIKLVMRDAVRVSAILGGCLSVALFAFPWVPAWIIGVDDPALLLASTQTVRIVSGSYVFFGIGTLFFTYYLFIGRRGASMTLAMLQELILPVLGVTIGAWVGGTIGFWTGYALSPVVAMAVFFGARFICRQGRFDPFLLPETDPRLTEWDVIVSDRTACEVAQGVHAKLEEFGAGMKVIVRADMLVEDTLMMVRDRNQGRKVRAAVMLDCREGVKLVFRDDGIIVTSFTDSGGGDWVRAQTLGAVINTAVGRGNAMTCGYNRAEFILEKKFQGDTGIFHP